ncbi:hypothetical protein FH972_025635 [Carpinus fangiana]|uniref:Uncharacterized protein n=1 Tax=Carpinus fangiana TaxID=176857 RepID=A0A5N6L465_9ROSI|nr:hypothetical protein FH972_025635 [Carpinus fangiana]
MPPSASRQTVCTLRPATLTRSPSSHTSKLSHPQARHASSQPLRQTKQRALMWSWLNGAGGVFRQPREGSTNYLGAYDRFGRLIRQRDDEGAKDKENKKEGEASDGEKKADVAAEKEAETLEDLRPFPLNPYFRSQSVLSEQLKDEIYKRVVVQKKTIREVSQALHVEMRRIAAVIRLKTVEQEWHKENKPLAKAYARAVTAMLPTTPYSPGSDSRPARHESINDLPVHEATLPQIFHPVPESRHFTRADAGHAFQRTLLPADARIPHPDMIEAARDMQDGMAQGERAARQRQRIQAEEAARLQRRTREEARERRGRTVVEGKRWDFVFREMDSEANAGRDGRAGKVGWRYGVPLEDRKKGMVKIPTSVE